MLKTVIVAGGLVLAGLSLAPAAATAAPFGAQADVATTAAPEVEKAQYYYRRRYARPRYYRPRYYAPRRYYRPRYYAPRRAYRPRYRYY